MTPNALMKLLGPGPTPQALQPLQSTSDASPSANVTEQSESEEQFDTFLNLLTAQIRNQDPLAPIDSTQFVDQLATFSGLELQATNNALLERIVGLLEPETAPDAA